MLDNFKNLDTLSILDKVTNQSNQMLASLTGQRSYSIDTLYAAETNHLLNTESRLKAEFFEGIERAMPSFSELVESIDESVNSMLSTNSFAQIECDHKKLLSQCVLETDLFNGSASVESLTINLRTYFSGSIKSALTINSLANIDQEQEKVLSQSIPDINITKEFNSMLDQAAIGDSYLLEAADSLTARAEIIGTSVNEATMKQALGDSLECLGGPTFNFLFEEINKYESDIGKIFSSSRFLENSLANLSMVIDTEILSSADLLSSSLGVDKSELLSAVNVSKYFADSVESIINSNKFTLGELISPYLGNINEDELLADLNSEELKSYSAAIEVIRNVINKLTAVGDKRGLYLLICKLKPYFKGPFKFVAGGLLWDLLSPHIKPLVLGFFINNGIECKTETNTTVFSDITYEVPIYVIPKNVSITVIHDKKSGTVSVSKKDLFGRSIHGFINPEQSCSK